MICWNNKLKSVKKEEEKMEKKQMKMKNLEKRKLANLLQLIYSRKDKRILYLCSLMENL